MMSSYINAALRQLVATRADYLCEYCLIHEEDSFFGCEVDHIISEKHGGQTEAENLAYACAFCNRSKGSDVGSLVQRTGAFVRFFNPRTDRWADHFALDRVTIIALSDVGEVTARILDLNNSERLFERQALQVIGKYPSASAAARLVRRT
ncbi:MAG: HNH endonuclease [Deltaproteobacteria bacterium]|nr:HNH endonuclease [Deltaproteobacteria bacterium]MBI2228040.1 HNH endonuclease [Deltaproteobacteria bacterium]